MINTNFLGRSSGKGCHAGSMALCPFGFGHGFPCGPFFLFVGNGEYLVLVSIYSVADVISRSTRGDVFPVLLSSGYRIILLRGAKARRIFQHGVCRVHLGGQYANNVIFVGLCFWFRMLFRAPIIDVQTLFFELQSHQKKHTDCVVVGNLSESCADTVAMRTKSVSTSRKGQEMRVRGARPYTVFGRLVSAVIPNIEACAQANAIFYGR